MTFRSDPGLIRLAAIGAFVAALALAGCGRKGALDPPAAAAAVEQNEAAQPDAGKGVDSLGNPVAPPGQKKRVFLDWLID